MTYDAARQSWKGNTEHALVCSVGNCNDIHALFISPCRSVGIPARLILGQALEAPLPGQEACELCGYHCWAEYFAPSLGWIPIDGPYAELNGVAHQTQERHVRFTESLNAAPIALDLGKLWRASCEATRRSGLG